MSRSPIFDQAAYGPDIRFMAILMVMAELEHLIDDGICLLCRLVEGDGPTGADVLVTGAVMHWSCAVLSCATTGDMVALSGRADPVDASASQVRPLLQVHNPARIEIWRRAAAGPNTTADAAGGAAA